jgi:hypothetical protein
MILVRPYQDEDAPRIAQIHGLQGFDYSLPARDKMLSCLIERDGEISSGTFLRKTAETFLLVDPSKPRQARLEDLMILHRELVKPARRAGFEDIHCWMPPEIEQRFGRLLKHLGWEKQLWPSYSRKVE